MNLTSTQLDIIGLLTQGRTDEQIARELTLGPATVSLHLNHINFALRKLSDNGELGLLADSVRAGLIRRQQPYQVRRSGSQSELLSNA